METARINNEKMKTANIVVGELDKFVGKEGRHSISESNFARLGEIITKMIADYFGMTIAYVPKLDIIAVKYSAKEYSTDGKGKFFTYETFHDPTNPFRFLKAWSDESEHIYRHERQYYADGTDIAGKQDRAYAKDTETISDIRNIISPLVTYSFH